MEITFHGAAGEVTGSCHIVRVGNLQILLDCGLIQGRAKDEARNREPFPFDPQQIDAVVLSHAEKVAMYCRMARTCSSIQHEEEYPQFSDAEESLKKEMDAQYQILTEFLQSS